MKRQYNTDRAISHYSTQVPPTDSTRGDAVNWGMGIAALVFCAYVGGWTIVAALVDVPWYTCLLCLPLSLLSGVSVAALKLICFTETHRSYLYRLETVFGVDIDDDGEIGVPQSGTLLVSGDGTFKRIDTTLTPEEIDAVKRHLLLSGKATVRALNTDIGDRATYFRSELIGALHICAPPEASNAAAVVTEAGKRALLRW
jgi:hypothetical protein